MCANYSNHPKISTGHRPDGICEDTYFYAMSVVFGCDIKDAPVKYMPKYSEVSKWPFLRGRC